MKRLFPLLALTLSCNLHPIANQLPEKIQVHGVSKMQAPSDCVESIRTCSYDSGLRYGTVKLYKCSADEGYKMHTREQNMSGNVLWYHTKLSGDLSDEEFSEWCERSFSNYKTFREETDKSLWNIL